jgi:hypothetical protein
MPVDRLEKPYFDWAMKHLECRRYRKMFEAWEKAKNLLEKYNSEYSKFIDFLKNQIRLEMKKSFPNFEENYQSGSSNLYYLNLILEKLETSFYIDDKEKKKSEFSYFITDRLAGGPWTICPRGFNIVPYMTSLNENELDLQKFQNLLLSISCNTDLMKQAHQLDKTHNEIWNEKTKMTDELQVLVGKLNAGMVIEGKCEFGC